MGDTRIENLICMKEAGIETVYHCWRLGEGDVTPFDPEERKRTLLNAKEAGLDVLDAVEPIGPEHTSDEFAERIFFSIETGNIQSGCMKRTLIPGMPEVYAPVRLHQADARRRYAC